MTALPTAASFTASTVTEAQFKAALTDLRAYLADLHDTTGVAADALRKLGVPLSNVVNRTGTTTMTTADAGKVMTLSNTWTYTLVSAASAGNGFTVTFFNIGTGTVTLAGAGSDTINGAATATIRPGQQAILVCDGTLWRLLFLAGVDGAGVSQVTRNSGAAESIDKRDNGILEMTKVATAIYVNPELLQYTWTLPTAFVSGSGGEVAVFVQHRSGGASITPGLSEIICNAGTVSTTSIVAQVRNTGATNFASGDSIVVSITAKGWWK